jgi:hypothetical protein
MAESARLDRAMRKDASQARARGLVKAAAQRADARVTVLAVSRGASGSDFVVADSQLERTAILPSLRGRERGRHQRSLLLRDRAHRR